MFEFLVECLPRNVARNAKLPVLNAICHPDLVEIIPQLLLLSGVQLSSIGPYPPKISLQSHNSVGHGFLHRARNLAERSGSATPRQKRPAWNRDAIAGFAAAGLFG